MKKKKNTKIDKAIEKFFKKHLKALQILAKK